MYKVLFWAGFGAAVRFWKLGLEKSPFFSRRELYMYPVYAGVGASFGWWLTGVDQQQQAILEARRNRLIEKRQRRAEREAGPAAA